jgi:aryl-alcohol dehydrogenase-like predicted oxidoreductase
VSRRRLGRSGLLVSEIGLGGAWLLGPRGDLPLEHGAAGPGATLITTTDVEGAFP